MLRPYKGKIACRVSKALLITGAAQLLTLRGRGARRAGSLSELGIIKDGALLIRDGLILAVGTRAKVEALRRRRVILVDA